MDWGKLFFSTEGRIGQKDFWIGALILIIIWVLSHLAHVFAPLVWLFLIWPWCAVYAKRLHDFGKSAWLIIWPLAVGIIAVTLAIVFGGIGLISGIWTASTNGSSAPAWGTLLGSLGMMLVFLGIAAVAKFVFLLWVGLHGGTPGPNQYGPEPGTVPAAPTAA